MKPINVLVCMPHLYDTAPGQRFRIEQWARLISSADARFTFSPFASPQLQGILYTSGRFAQKLRHAGMSLGRRILEMAGSLSEFDIVFLYRELLPVGPASIERWLARKGIPIIYDFDDAIYLPSASEANRRFSWLKRPEKVRDICRLSSVVITGNDILAQYARQFSNRVIVIPTTIDTDAYALKKDWASKRKVVIGWSGSHTTVVCLRTIEPALKALAKSHDFQLKVIGDSRYSLSGVDVSSQAWIAATEVSDLETIDIGIMPLPDDAWTRGKCGLKALQYMALGIPTVASPVGVNAEIIQDGENGLLASASKEWVEKLTLLLKDAALRERLGKAGRRTVEEKFSGKLQAERLLDVFRQATSTIRRKEYSA